MSERCVLAGASSCAAVGEALAAGRGRGDVDSGPEPVAQALRAHAPSIDMLRRRAAAAEGLSPYV